MLFGRTGARHARTVEWTCGSAASGKARRQIHDTAQGVDFSPYHCKRVPQRRFFANAGSEPAVLFMRAVIESLDEWSFERVMIRVTSATPASRNGRMVVSS